LKNGRLADISLHHADLYVKPAPSLDRCPPRDAAAFTLNNVSS
jgi:hypothetical protein